MNKEYIEFEFIQTFSPSISQLKTAAGYDRPEVQFRNKESPRLFSSSLPVILGPSRGKSKKKQLFQTQKL